MSIGILIGVLIVVFFIGWIGIRSGRSVKNAEDFNSGGKNAGVLITVGTLVGTLVGGSSTIGTSQLAEIYGFSAIWFTLGGAVGLIMYLPMIKPLRKSGCVTILSVIQKEYGSEVGRLSSVLCIIGCFLSIVSQVLSASALLSSLFPIPPAACSLICTGLIMLYIFSGGIRGIGSIGLFKTVLLILSAAVCGVTALKLSGGLNSLKAQLPEDRYFNVFARGVGIDLGAGLSVVLGVLSSQAYAQSAFSGRDEKTAYSGFTISAILTPLIGIGSIFVGMYMKLAMPEIASAQVFPQFIINYLPSVAAGAVLGTLLIAIIGTGAGLTMSISAIVWNDLVCGKVKNGLLISRITVAATMLMAFFFSLGSMQSLVLKWSFMSMAFRGAVTFPPLIGALFFPKKIGRKWVTAAVAAGPATVLIGNLIPGLAVDPLFIGLLCGILLMAAGYAFHSKGEHNEDIV